MNILIIFGTVEGQTEKVAKHMASIIRNKGHHVTIKLSDQLTDNFKVHSFDGAIIGGSIHMGKYPASIKQFITSHIVWLNNRPSAFFTICMGINSQNEKSREEAKHYGEDFIKRLNWNPNTIGTFAGAVKYTQYNFVTRFIMKLISKWEGGSTDTSRDHEYTDWESVSHFTEKFIAEIESLDIVGLLD
jgi:menaquinone-dependent protoporphyrinogen oxidase